jgi:hypothetical protein
MFLKKWIAVGAYFRGMNDWKERDVVIMLTLREG